MYYVVNYRKSWNYGAVYTFKEARNIYNDATDKDCIIEYYDKYYNKKIVWPKRKMRR